MRSNPSSNTSKKNQIKKMFDSISNKYDYLNGIITFGNHSKWKKEIAEIAKLKTPKKILDVATGTADIAINLSSIKNCRIYGIDISERMIKIAKQKAERQNIYNNISLEIGDAENLKFSNNFFDILTIGFGIRNFIDLDKGLKESYRVLKKSGYIIILETSLPKNIFIKVFYLIFSRVFIPIIGKLFSNNPKAYKYLQESTEKFYSVKDVVKKLSYIGFREIETRSKLFGASTIYVAKK